MVKVVKKSITTNILIRRQYSFERNAEDSACFIDIEKNTRLQLRKAIGSKRKRKKKITRSIGLEHQRGLPLIGGRLD
jgi:hypothetical protein